MVLPLGEVRILERLLGDGATGVVRGELAHDRGKRAGVGAGRRDREDEHEAFAREYEETSAHERPLGIVPAAGDLVGRGCGDARILLVRLDPGQVDELPDRVERVPHDLQRRLHPLPPRDVERRISCRSTIAR